MSLFYIFKINCIFILITFYFKILVYCTSNFVPICILESYRVLSVCITWYSFNLFFMLRNNFDHLYDFCVCHEDALIYNITPTHQYILFCVTSWMVHWSLALGFHTDSIIIKKKPWWLVIVWGEIFYPDKKITWNSCFICNNVHYELLTSEFYDTSMRDHTSPLIFLVFTSSLISGIKFS